MSGSGSDREESDEDRWLSDWWDDEDDSWAGIASLLVTGLGLASLFGLVPIGPFWAIFAIGFAVVVPIVAVLESRYGRASESTTPPESEARARAERAADEDDSVADALDRLRDRYARGDLSDEQFERKLEVLLETDTPENARERADRRRDERKREGRERESSERET
ncbi:SHOCT domain-containing protein [Halogeometricum sp. S1BR25-6]|uniref:SHOCT domain-containing protein n=1 Tax=Halogeometricum salsisoli TaxID=2950536 RepID=A0ABU2G999_9EURY|nr:SHOCT domain-containing protein [Halogeometricum sp. S1BR25-6]MDS0297392.1 SHOCT domain-containing protein [Halogeometricum sp. S1BR25-6]